MTNAILPGYTNLIQELQRIGANKMPQRMNDGHDAGGLFPDDSTEFSMMLRESVVDGIRNVLGEKVMVTILFHLKLGDRIENPGEFHSRLQLIFKAGAATLEKIMVRELYRKLNLPYQEAETFDFERDVTKAMETFNGIRK